MIKACAFAFTPEYFFLIQKIVLSISLNQELATGNQNKSNVIFAALYCSVVLVCAGPKNLPPSPWVGMHVGHVWRVSGIRNRRLRCFTEYTQSCISVSLMASVATQERTCLSPYYRQALKPLRGSDLLVSGNRVRLKSSTF